VVVEKKEGKGVGEVFGVFLVVPVEATSLYNNPLRSNQATVYTPHSETATLQHQNDTFAGTDLT
jgi:hypothetical protein